METTCLSLATILRCQSLDSTEQIAIFAVDAVHALCVFGLLAFKWNTSDRSTEYPLLVIGEFFLVAISLLDFVAHIIPESLTSWQVFKAIDVLVGSVSFIPLGFYALFLFYLTRSHLFPYLQGTLLFMCKYFLPALIPLTVAFNEVGSFAGISYGTVADESGIPMLDVNFSDRDLWIFFTSLTLAAFAIYQAIIFCLLSFKLVKASLFHRRMSNSSSGQSQIWFVRGSAWVAIGINMGIVEAVVGFTLDGFGVTLARRIIRLVGRACLIVGIIKGMDSYENFRMLEAEEINARPRRFSTARLRQMISNPRNSTFAHLSPSARTFYAMPRAVDREGPEMQESYPNNFGRPPGQRQDKQRVTVHYDGAHAPRLEIRLSRSDLLSVKTANSSRRRNNSDPILTNSKRPSAEYLRAPVTAIYPSHQKSSFFKDRNGKYGVHPDHPQRALSTDTIASDSLNSISVIAKQFPNLPSSNAGKTPLPNGPAANLQSNGSASPPRVDAKSGRPMTGNTEKNIILWRRARARRFKHFPLSIDSTLAPPGAQPGSNYEIYVSSPLTPNFHDSAADRQQQPVSPSIISPDGSSMYTNQTTPVSNPFAAGNDYGYADSVISEGQSPGLTVHGRDSEIGIGRGRGRGQMEDSNGNRPPMPEHKLTYPLLHRPLQGKASQIIRSPTLNPWFPRTRTSAMLAGGQLNAHEAWQNTALGRIKSIGVVSARRTPTPTHGAMKGSMKIDLSEISKSGGKYDDALEEPPVTMESEMSSSVPPSGRVDSSSAGGQSLFFTLELSESDVEGTPIRSAGFARSPLGSARSPLRKSMKASMERQDLIDLPDFGPSSYESGMLSRSRPRRDSDLFGEQGRAYIALNASKEAV